MAITHEIVDFYLQSAGRAEPVTSCAKAIEITNPTMPDGCTGVVSLDGIQSSACLAQVVGERIFVTYFSDRSIWELSENDGKLYLSSIST